MDMEITSFVLRDGGDSDFFSPAPTAGRLAPLGYRPEAVFLRDGVTLCLYFQILPIILHQSHSIERRMKSSKDTSAALTWSPLQVIRPELPPL